MSNRKGLAIVTFSMVAAVLVPFVGVAMDGVMLVVVKERLTSAVDSSAAAAARYPGNSARMESAAQRFLDANFPQGYMGTTSRTFKIEGDRLVVRVAAPTYFMKLLHVKHVDVSASQRITGEQ